MILAASHVRAIATRAGARLALPPRWSPEAIEALGALAESAIEEAARRAARVAYDGGRRTVQAEHLAAPAAPERARAEPVDREQHEALVAYNRALIDALAAANRSREATGLAPILPTPAKVR